MISFREFLNERTISSKKVDILEELNKVTSHKYTKQVLYTKQSSLYISRNLDQDDLLEAIYKDEVNKDIFSYVSDIDVFSEEELMEMRPIEEDEDEEEYQNYLYDAVSQALPRVVADILTERIVAGGHIQLNQDIAPHDPMGFKAFFRLSEEQASDLIVADGDYFKAGLGIILTKQDYSKENLKKHSFEYYLNANFQR